ncbi:MAG: ABC transporter substrate-binding protein, partial [Paracoccaceae bacterium]
MRYICHRFAALAFMLLFAAPVAALDVRTGVLRVDYPTILPISRYDLKSDDLGFSGAVLANEDNQTTGTFLGMTFSVDYVSATPEEASAKLAEMLRQGTNLIVLMANAKDTLMLADQAGKNALVINASARDTSLRDDQCRANLIHVAPSYVMLADAVAQFALWKKWPRWFLIYGSNPDDRALGEAYRRSARKFGAKIVEEREFEDTGGSRRTDTGHVLVQRQIP